MIGVCCQLHGNDRRMLSTSQKLLYNIPPGVPPLPYTVKDIGTHPSLATFIKVVPLLVREAYCVIFSCPNPTTAWLSLAFAVVKEET